MKRLTKQLINFPLYPFLLGMFPVIAIYAANIGEARLIVIIRPLLVFLAGTTIFILLFRLLLRDWHRAAFAASSWLILFSTYGHLVIFLQDQEIAHPSYLLPVVWITLASFILWLSSIKRIQFKLAASSLNLIALVLLVYPLYQIIPSSIKNFQYERNVRASSVLTPQDSQSFSELPDIYYIIPDMYTRSDLLLEAYGYDNSEFIKYLEDKGFYVARCSQSNYMRTDVALASTLNLDYLQNLSDKFKPDSYSRTYLFELLKNSTVRKTLEEAGYQTIAFATGFPWSELSDADIFMSPSPLETTLTDFEGILLNTTLARILGDTGVIDPFQISSLHYRERTSFIFESIPEIIETPGPKFSFIHIINPHPPFVFGPNGEFTDPAAFHNDDDKITTAFFAEGYINQVQYINSQLEQVIDTIMQNSSVPPVIILQGDHGPWLQTKNKRFWILNAYFLPGNDIELYPAISPVNSFRIVLDNYLGLDYPLLEDKSYFSPIPYIYDFTYYSNPCK